LAEALRKASVSTFLAEYPGYSDLPGSLSEAGLYDGGEGARQAFQDIGDSAPLVIVGRSLGTGVAVELARRKAPGLLGLVSPYTSIVGMGRAVVGPFAPLLVPDRFDSLSKISAVSCPVTIFHGTGDEVVPFEMGRRVAAAGRAVRFVPVEGHGHNDLPDVA